MSIGAELTMRGIADYLGGVAYLSEFGDGCPLLEEADIRPIRLAQRPVCGISRRAGAATYLPPMSLSRQAADCARIARSLPLFVDALADGAADLIARAIRLSQGAPAAIRLRGGGQAPSDLRLIYEDDNSEDRVFLRRDLINDEIMRRANALATARVDEFDDLGALMGPKGVVCSLRHGADLSEVIFAAPPMLDQPDAPQLAAALGEGRVIMALDGGCALVAPQLSAAPHPVGLMIKGLHETSPDPELTLPNAPDWTVRSSRRDAEWRAVAQPPKDAAPLISVFIELAVQGGAAAEVVEVTSGITRKRGGWEIWDEAQKQLELEESW